MEQQNNAENSAAAPIAGENGTNAAQEVTSTTPSEPTKRSLRVQTWKKIQQNKCGAEYNGIFNRIPSFIDSDKAAALLAETDEFKKAKNIKINIDRALNAAKYQALVANKSLYLPSTRESNALYLHVDVPADSTEEQKKSIINVKDVHEHRSEIALENKVKFDMVIIGSVLVSRDGYRIGRGNGFADLDIGLLIEIGSVTPDTIIATMVHDLQVVDTLPTDLFQKYDAPVDMIITPTEVIRVQKRLPRPAGLFWDLLSERRLKIISVLQVLKEQQEKAGKVITLKQEDTDIEQNQNNRRRRGTMRRRFVRRYPRRAQSQTDTEQQGGGEGGQQQQKRNPRRQRRFVNRRRRQTKVSEGDQSAPEKSQDRSQGRGGRQGGQEGGNRDRRQQRQRKNRLNRDFCIKLSNLTRGVRVTDLKTELRKRECKPLFITWKGQYGKCILHFGNRTGVPSTDDDIERVMTALNDLSLTVPVNSGNGNGTGNNNNVENGDGDGVNKIVKTKTVNVNVELIKFDEKKNNEQQQTNGGGNAGAATTVGSGDGGDGDNSARIESVDTTTV